MIAEVYPLLKLPRRFSFFDYSIPENLKVRVGDIVEISFRKQKVLGVVRSVKTSTKVKRLIPITSTITKIMNTKDVQRLEQVAKVLKQPPSNIFKTAFEGFKGRKQKITFLSIPKRNLSIDIDSVSIIKRVLSGLNNKQISAQLSLEGACALIHTLRKKLKGQILVLCPREQLAVSIGSSINLGKKTALLHGHTKPKDREAIIRAWSQGEIHTLIGTRQTSLLPTNKLSAVIVIDAASENYSHTDRNPRFDARRSAELLAKQYNANYIETSPSPTVESLYKSFKMIWQNKPSPKIIDIKKQDERSDTLFITQTLFDATSDALQSGKSVLFSFNRKGVANHLQCGDCGHIPFCGSCGQSAIVRKDDLVCSVCKVEMWIPKVCPNCKSEKIKEKGIGNERLKSVLEKAFPRTTIGVLEKDKQEPGQIQIVTEYFFQSLRQPFPKTEFGLVAELNFDLSFVNLDFRAMELAAYKMHRLINFAKTQKAPCIIQTWSPEMVKPMKNAEQFLKAELEIRKKYQLPPTKTIIKTFSKNNAFDDIIEIDTASYDT